MVPAPKSESIALRAYEPPSEAAPPAQRSILSGVLAGERWAHEQLYDMLLPTVTRTLGKILRDSTADYEDLLQSVFERIVRSLSTDRGAHVRNLNSWANSIAAHVALDALRQRIRERRFFERNKPTLVENVPAASLERQLEARRQLEWLQDTLAQINPDQAQTVLMHDVLGHPVDEIAAVMGVTVAAAQRRLSRGHQELLRRSSARDGRKSR
ncbi:MAG TPA: RNA polymerase sigma factor [Polyangiaceae bacterium]|nr:RNA polymerase sigma factor [Polyangiaceae bacterium]